MDICLLSYWSCITGKTMIAVSEVLLRGVSGNTAGKVPFKQGWFVCCELC